MSLYLSQMDRDCHQRSYVLALTSVISSLPSARLKPPMSNIGVASLPRITDPVCTRISIGSISLNQSTDDAFSGAGVSAGRTILGISLILPPDSDATDVSRPGHSDNDPR